MECSVCRSLGFSASTLKGVGSKFPVRVSPSRQQSELRASSESGCKFCGMILQASKLFRSAVVEPPLTIYIYEHSPAEIHSALDSDYYDVVEIYACSNEADTAFPRLARDVPPDASSQESLRFLEESYADCRKAHAECRQLPTSLPTRLIDITGPTPKLFEPEDHETDLYVALSYCWGKNSFKVLTTSNLAQLKQEIPAENMTICFRDAAFITRRLGIPYIWIDTMCILQDDESDWERESSKMAEVYQNAALVIAASSSSDPNESFLIPKDEYYSAITLDFISDDQQSRTFKARRKAAVGIHAKLPRTGPQDPLTLRAWALQEQELATRYISFNGAELQWQCQQVSLCECHEAPGAPTQCMSKYLCDTTGSAQDIAMMQWHLLVGDYTFRNLTYAKDKLPALSGLARKFSEVIRSDYVAGMWKEHLIIDLSWQRHANTPLQPALQDIAPSFAWASLSGPVDYQPARESYPGQRVYHAEIIDAYCPTTGDNPFGQVSGGSMKIRGPTITATLHSPDVTDAQSYFLTIGDKTFMPSTFQRAACEFSIDTLLISVDTTASQNGEEVPSLRRSAQQVSGAVTGEIRVLSLFSIVHEAYSYEVFLLLGTSEAMPQAYQRLGVGTGKVYREENAVPGPQEKAPFGWLRHYNNYVEGTLCEPQIVQVEVV